MRTGFIAYMPGIKRLSDRISSFPYLSVFFLPLVFVTLAPTEDRYAFVSKLFMAIAFLVSGICLQNTYQALVPIEILGVLYLSVLWSVSPPLSLHGAIQVTYYVLLFSIFRDTQFNPRAMMWGIRMLVSVALLISIYALEQHLFGYGVPPTVEQITRDWMTALSGRVFSRFALPSQLAGYLLMILPLNLLLFLQERFVGVRLFWGMGFLLNSLIFFYTKSFGAWLSFLCMLAVGLYVFISWKRALTWRTVLKASVLFCIGGWAILYLIGVVRGQYLWDFQGNNPLWYRFLNWKTAIQIFRDHPFLGTGFFTFGQIYPQYMLPGANESQYVHNSYLQIGSELGLIGLIIVGWLTGRWCRSALTLLTKCHQSYTKNFSQEHHKKELFGISCFFGGFAFVLHNIIDFDFYVFPLGVFGVSLLALTLNILTPSPPEIGNRRRFKHPRAFAGYGVILCLLLVIYLTDWRYAQGKQYQEHAITLVQSAHYQEAATQIRNALQNAPDVAEYLALEGSILLYLQQTDSAIQRFQAAIHYEPETPWFHAGLAEAYLANQNLSLAYVESRRAAELFPQRLTYQQRVQEIHTLFSTF